MFVRRQRQRIASFDANRLQPNSVGEVRTRLAGPGLQPFAGVLRAAPCLKRLGTISLPLFRLLEPAREVMGGGGGGSEMMRQETDLYNSLQDLLGSVCWE